MGILISILFCSQIFSANLEQSFKTPPGDSRIMVRWWWFGPPVTKPQLEREMRAMKDGGIGRAINMLAGSKLPVPSGILGKVKLIGR